LLVSIKKGVTTKWVQKDCEFIRKGKPTKENNTKKQSDHNKQKTDYKKVIIEEVKNQFKNKLCPECNGELEVKLGRYGAFWGCQNYPECKETQDFDQEKVKKIVEDFNFGCPKEICDGHIRLVITRRSAFLGCSNYPDCDFIEFF